MTLLMVQPIVLHLLRDAKPDVEFTTWASDIDYRNYPFVNIRRVGGERNKTEPKKFALPVIEMTAYTDEGDPETHELYEECLDVLYDAVRHQTQTPAGYLHSIDETMGATQFSSPYSDTWRCQGLIQLGIRPPRTP
ncbi:tail terminator [Mycobacterium phage Astro]|uniref:Tail terminator n=3 Tax=Fromanvirus astro TaxID=1195075 RepID=I6RA17_9CAUD|nr:tail terminator [Mycobacterium phage Smeadley]YP_009638476.1 tail terminator [Mycobacterium phage Astro]AXQ63524.1 tail terminator [Mycobacterium phage Dixon]AYD86947.1 tail terminator [Mycobacterium phage NearlyHeadless]QBI96612.1 tail terminator [Mycobacterium phage Expelliarmus]QDH92972.1 tail terminator [Mycobacterium phage Stephig9]QHB36910.1 tail terminator [Mycobacterium phage Roary]QJD50120.1 tail terminator [Mycobacterium phage Danforth]WNO26704.1 tail terminator [Mycobacterium 